MRHEPVLTKEVLQYLDPKPNENIIDATIGEAGHSIEILKRISPSGILLGIDLDPLQIENAKIRTADFKERTILVNDSYTKVAEIIKEKNLNPVNGILADIGVSSWQLEESRRGFSFLKNEILDMRYNIQGTLTAKKIVNEYPEAEIEKILREHGEEKFSKQIAKKIVKERKIREIESTFELKDVIEKAIPAKFRYQRISFATRTFQALRIAVNGELDNLKEFLPRAIEALDSDGRLVVISFHSLEDRIVKNFFKEQEKENIIKILTKKPVIADSEELLKNPRSGSAKLRAIVKK